MSASKYISFLIVINVLSCFADDNQINNQIFVRVNGQRLEISYSPSESDKAVAQRIKQTIIDSAIKDSNITISDEVLSNCMDLYVLAGGENPTNIVRDVSSESAIIINALRKVVLEHQDKEDVYHKYLQESVSQTEWQTWLKSYDTKEKIDKLESLTPHSVDDLKRFSKESLKRDIEMWLLFHKITESASPSSREIHAFYKKIYPNNIPQFVEVENIIKEEATKQLQTIALNKWWQEQVAKASIDLPARLSKVNDFVGITPTLSFLPPSIISILEKLP